MVLVSPLTITILHLRVVEHLRRDPNQFEDSHNQRSECDRSEGEGGGSDKGSEGGTSGETGIALAGTVVVPAYTLAWS